MEVVFTAALRLRKLFVSEWWFNIIFSSGVWSHDSAGMKFELHKRMCAFVLRNAHVTLVRRAFTPLDGDQHFWKSLFNNSESAVCGIRSVSSAQWDLVLKEFYCMNNLNRHERSITQVYIFLILFCTGSKIGLGIVWIWYIFYWYFDFKFEVKH